MISTYCMNCCKLINEGQSHCSFQCETQHAKRIKDSQINFIYKSKSDSSSSSTSTSTSSSVASSATSTSSSGDSKSAWNAADISLFKTKLYSYFPNRTIPTHSHSIVGAATWYLSLNHYEIQFQTGIRLGVNITREWCQHVIESCTPTFYAQAAASSVSRILAVMCAELYLLLEVLEDQLFKAATV